MINAPTSNMTVMVIVAINILRISKDAQDGTIQIRGVKKVLTTACPAPITPLTTMHHRLEQLKYAI